MKRRRASELVRSPGVLRRTIVPAVLAGAIGFAGCASNSEHEAPAQEPMTIEQALSEHTEAWMRVDGVEGTGIGLCDDTPCIKIFVSRPPEEFSDLLPDTVEGHPVRLEPTGRFGPR